MATDDATGRRPAASTRPRRARRASGARRAASSSAAAGAARPRAARRSAPAPATPIAQAQQLAERAVLIPLDVARGAGRRVDPLVERVRNGVSAGIRLVGDASGRLVRSG